MSIFQIKMIAIITMVIDHIGAFMFPQIYTFRMIGRLSFVLFAWLIANGAIHTKNMKQYLQRLFLMGVISQVPYLAIHRLHNPNSMELNIFATLFLGLLAIYVIQKIKKIFLVVPLVIFLALVAEKFANGFSYGAYGVISIVTFYLFFKNIKYMFVSQMILLFMFFTLPAILSGKTFAELHIAHSMMAIQPLALLSFLFIYLYNGKLGSKKFKWLFYWFYPIHLAIIYLFVINGIGKSVHL